MPKSYMEVLDKIYDVNKEFREIWPQLDEERRRYVIQQMEKAAALIGSIRKKYRITKNELDEVEKMFLDLLDALDTSKEVTKAFLEGMSKIHLTRSSVIEGSKTLNREVGLCLSLKIGVQS